MVTPEYRSDSSPYSPMMLSLELMMWQQYHLLVAQGFVNEEEGLMQEMVEVFNNNESVEV
jgi:hypothetical protein